MHSYIWPVGGSVELRAAGKQQPEEERRKKPKPFETPGELQEAHPGHHAFIMQSSVHLLTDASCGQNALPHGDCARNKAPVERGGLLRHCYCVS